MQNLISDFYSVMQKYGKHFSPDGVKANLARWAENKAVLISLLRNHPNWNEDAQAVIFEITLSREIDRENVRRYRDAICELIAPNYSDERINQFNDAIISATNDFSPTPSEANIERIKEQANGI